MLKTVCTSIQGDQTPGNPGEIEELKCSRVKIGRNDKCRGNMFFTFVIKIVDA